jgi:hypothetical protein
MVVPPVHALDPSIPPPTRGGKKGIGTGASGWGLVTVVVPPGLVAVIVPPGLVAVVDPSKFV